MVSDSRVKLGSLILLTLLGYLSLALERYRRSEAAVEEGSDCMRKTELRGWRLAHPVLILLHHCLGVPQVPRLLFKGWPTEIKRDSQLLLISTPGNPGDVLRNSGEPEQRSHFQFRFPLQLL